MLASRRLRNDARFAEGLAEAAEQAGCGSLLAIPLVEPAGDGLGLVIVFFRGETHLRRRPARPGRACCGCRAGCTRAKRAVRARAARSLARAAACTRRCRARRRARSGQPCSISPRGPRSSCSTPQAPRSGCSRATRWSGARPSAPGSSSPVGARTPSTAWLVGDIVQTRVDPRDRRRQGTTPGSRDVDAMISAGYAAYLGVPMIGPDGSVQGILAVYAERPRVWRAEEEEVLLALAATATSARMERRAVPGRGARSSSGARRSSPTSPTGSSPSTARGRSCSGTRPPSG